MDLINSKLLLEYCYSHNISLFEFAIRYEMSISSVSRDDIIRNMREYWHVMCDSITKGLNKNIGGSGKIIERKAKDVFEFSTRKENICAAGTTMTKAVSYGLGVMEVNVTMGKIIASPTAGSSGVIPGVFMSLKETFNLSEEKIIEGLIVASLVGVLIAKNASLSGAKGGCQAEVGSAAAMAAAAGLYMLDADNEQIFAGGAIALKNLMGLICDPVAGLVEVPCQKRNAIGIADSLVAIDLVRAGMVSYIPFDEVIDAMKRVGDLMPTCHRETATGGIASSPTGKMYKKQIFSGVEIK